MKVWTFVDFKPFYVFFQLLKSCLTNEKSPFFVGYFSSTWLLLYCLQKEQNTLSICLLYWTQLKVLHQLCKNFRAGGFLEFFFKFLKIFIGEMILLPPWLQGCGGDGPHCPPMVATPMILYHSHPTIWPNQWTWLKFY